MKTIALIISLCFAGQSTARVSFAEAKPKEDKRVSQLENERKKLVGTTSPEGRAKSLMRIAAITLSYVGEAANSNDFPKMQSYVERYRQAVTDARDAMIRSGKNPDSKSGGYKAVEIALRKQIRSLQDISRTLNTEDRQPLDDTLETVTKIRDEFIQALFGSVRISFTAK